MSGAERSSLAGARARPTAVSPNRGSRNPGGFAAKKGQRLILEVNARRLGSPLDSSIEILDARGQPVQRATLPCLAKTYTTFRDHDSAGPGIRIETWSELAVNDYLLVGTELLRIRDLPKNPDDDCQFFSGGTASALATWTRRRRTTAWAHAMYKVAIHPPGTTFPPNGLPVVHLDYRNDDGGPGYGKDSRLFFDPPADGDYLVRVGDWRGRGRQRVRLPADGPAAAAPVSPSLSTPRRPRCGKAAPFRSRYRPTESTV